MRNSFHPERRWKDYGRTESEIEGRDSRDMLRASHQCKHSFLDMACLMLETDPEDRKFLQTAL